MKLPKYYIGIFLILLVLITIGIFFILTKPKPGPSIQPKPEIGPIEEAEETPSLSADSDIDVGPPHEASKPLSFPPETIKAVYGTSWSVSKESFIDYVIDIAKTTEINAVVIDIKDFSGYVAYDTKLPKVKEYNAKQIRIRNIDSLLQKLHEEGIYVIARISVFQDPRLAQARPDLAIHSKSKLSSIEPSTLSTSSLWFDDMGLAWIDPAAKEAWSYNVDVAREAVGFGFDELNFDYIRFPSDGNIHDIVFPFWDGITPRHEIIREFFKYLRQELPATKISVDLFGLSTVSSNDLGVGQIIEDAYEYFDYVCPMVYPSHYDSGFLGYQEPAEYPYEVVKYSMENALRRLGEYNQSFGGNAKLRPWLQDFDLGTPYDAGIVRLEIEAVYEVTGDDFEGFMLWNSWNVYTKDALEPSR